MPNIQGVKMFLNKLLIVNYITNSTENQDLDLTLNYEFGVSEVLNVLVTLKKDGNSTDTQEVEGTAIYNGYYSTLSVSGLNVDLESFYSIDINKDGNNLYKGKAFVTTQTIGEYEINNDNYIKQATDTTNFTIFE